MMRSLLLVQLITFLLLLNKNESVAQDLDVKFGEGIRFTAPDSSFYMKFEMRFQPLFVANKQLKEESSILKEIFIRRTRLKFSGFALSPRLKYKLELALSNRDNGRVIPQGNTAANIVLDAFVDYNLTQNLFIRAGQFKLPGNRERVISSQNLQFVDRSLVNSRYTLDRDKGIMFGHGFNLGNVVFKEYAALTMGQGRNITIVNDRGLSYTGRAEVLPFGEFTAGGDYFGSDLVREETPKLSVGFGYNFHDDAIRQRGFRGGFLSAPRDIHTFFADAMFKFRGFSMMSEYMYKYTNDPVLEGGEYFTAGDGFVIQAGYLFENNWEIAGRFTMINSDEDLFLQGLSDDVREYTLGLSRYIVGHSLKVQTDLSYTTSSLYTVGDQDGAIRYRLQMEIAI